MNLHENGQRQVPKVNEKDDEEPTSHCHSTTRLCTVIATDGLPTTRAAHNATVVTRVAYDATVTVGLDKSHADSEPRSSQDNWCNSRYHPTSFEC